MTQGEESLVLVSGGPVATQPSFWRQYIERTVHRESKKDVADVNTW